MRVLIHADGGPGIGLGHASRCSALSSALRRRGHAACIAVTRASGLASYLHGVDAPAIEAGDDPESLRAQVRDLEAHAVVIDSYKWRADDFAALRLDRRPVVAFDDEGKWSMPVDVVINGAPIAESLAYDVLPDTHLLAGLSYQIVRDDFRDVPARTIAPAVERILALVGGDDPLGVLAPLAGCLDDAADTAAARVRIELVCGPYAAAPKPTRWRHVEILRHPDDLADRMKRADLAVSASGQTLYELARCGTPTVAFLTGADQARNLAALAAAGVVVDAGEAGDDRWLDRVAHAVRSLAGDPRARTEMSRRGQQLIDGRGADRVADAIVHLMERHPR